MSSWWISLVRLTVATSFALGCFGCGGSPQAEPAPSSGQVTATFQVEGMGERLGLL